MLFKRLMTDEEVADLLHCSARRVQYLRVTKQIAFVDIIPPLITDVALEEYVASHIQAALDPAYLLLAAEMSGRDVERMRIDSNHWLWVLRQQMLGTLPLLKDVAWAGNEGPFYLRHRKSRRPPITDFTNIKLEATPARPRKPNGSRLNVKQLSKGKLQQGKNGFWYVHWSEGRRSMRQTAKTKDRALAEVFLEVWRKTGGKLSGVLLQPSERRPPPDAELRQVVSGSWYLFWSDGRRSMRLSTRTKDEAEAIRIRRVWSAGKEPRQPKISGSG
jgi:hypothetical protein